MKQRPATLVLLSDGLEFPPRLGYQVHLLSLARVAAAWVPTRIFCWTDGGERSTEELSDIVAPLAARAGEGRLAAKRRYLDQALAWIEANAGPGSVLWVRSYSTAFLLWPRLRRLRRLVSGLVTVYDASSFHRLEAGQGASRLLGQARALVEERLWRGFDRVRTLNEPMAAYLVKRGVPRDKILVLPVGSETRTARWAPSPRPPRLLYVGSDAPWQGLAELIEAMRLLERSDPGVRLTVVGPERDGLGRPAPPANVEFRGRVPHARIGEVYLEHDLFVLPRPRVPLTDLVLPMKLPEAMSFGMPILASDLQAVRSMTGEEGALLVESNQPRVLAEAIRGALSDPARLAAVGAAALVRSRAFTWERIGEEMARRLFPGAPSARREAAHPE